MPIRYFIILLFAGFIATGYLSPGQQPVKVYSWNLKDFGKSKSEAEIIFIAGILKDAEIVAVQEVVAGDGGAQAVARLNEALNLTGDKWDYIISDPTYSSSYKTERYAFLWKTARVKKTGRAWLEETYKVDIDREPYYATFSFNEKEFTLVNFHAITKAKQPETEIKYFKFLPAQYPQLNLLFCGDFNLPESHTVFNPLKKMGYRSALQQQKTSLKKECKDDDCLSSEFDNFYYRPAKIKVVNTGIVPFYKSFESLHAARLLSDHVPVYLQFTLN